MLRSAFISIHLSRLPTNIEITHWEVTRGVSLYYTVPIDIAKFGQENGSEFICSSTVDGELERTQSYNFTQAGDKFRIASLSKPTKQ